MPIEPCITITNARLHNLKNVTLSIPKGKLVALTGVSGSGKSTLGFDILLKEGLRQYLESVGMVAFGLEKPPVDAIVGLSPTISVDQYLTNHSPRSTVGTTTEIYTYLRVLFARLGHRICPACGGDVPPPYDASPIDWSGDDIAEASEGESSISCPHCGAALPEIGMANFSFNKPAGACPTCTGLGTVHQANMKRLVNEELSILDGAVYGWNSFQIRYHADTLQAASRHYGFSFDPALPVRDYPPIQRDLLFFGVESPRFRQHFPGVEPPTAVNRGRFEGVAGTLLRRYAEHIQDADYLQKLDEFLVTQVCPDCNGTRLRAESRAVTVAGQTIIALSQLPLNALADWLDALPASLHGEETLIASPILDDLRERIRRVLEVGVEYLTLERAAPSLSAGEAQRLRMASLLGSSLSGLLYVFDEPTIGLHSRDTQRLIGFLRRLRDLGNTVLVVEHDLDVVGATDYVVDFGPGAGKHGGQIVATGTPAEIAQMPGTLTGAYLAGRMSVPMPQQRRAPTEKALTVHGAREHNLQNVTVRLPLGLLVAVTGVSGSGKSSLVFDILDKSGRQRFYGASETPGVHEAIEGWENLDKIVTIDQEHIVRLPRSNAATYSDAFTAIREAFAATADARRLKLTARHFSFNVPGGRCERCEGTGTLTVKMHFLPDVAVTCPACRGRRFKPETLAVKYHEHDIAQTLELTIEEALVLFKDVPAAASRLGVMADVGLGYLQLGQPASTLSGGEAQRVKLAKELGRRGAGRTLYLLDEPTTGLHPADTALLLALLQRLVDAGNSVIVVEHNLDIIKGADWVIDLGPEGGAAGGQLIAEGTPEQVARVSGSHTGACLRRIL
ncbi:MAG TPA: excinuclease ABC subunit UvrA [Ktedonobacterales bacterium]|nr:excinuclease ABC subunit UvrA [Ktedonobacterales bacterium]